MPTSSIIISTYNWPQALAACLRSVLAQSQLPSEIIVADDGSGNETKEVVEAFIKESTVPLKHVWQADEGFKLSQIRNKSIARASGDYIIQIDGDLILHRHFVRDHIKFSRQGCFTTGSRVLLSAEQTTAILAGSSNASPFAKNFLNGLHVPALHKLLASRYKQSGKQKYYVKGCNMAFWKTDLLTVNGYNEDFTGWGKEDSEIAIRLINAGVQKRFLKFGGIAYHLFHREASRELEARNEELMNESIENGTVSAINGLRNYL